MLSFEELFARHDWEPLPNCPGRFRLSSPLPGVSPVDLVGADSEARRLRSDACQDEFCVRLLSDGGALLSYRRADGSFFHTLNTAAGLSRKLEQLGVDLSGTPRDGDV